MKITFLIVFLFFSNILFAQNFTTANFLSGTSNLRINESVKTASSIFIYGDFLGSLNQPENIVADGRDIFFAKYDNDFNPIWIKHIGGSLLDLAQDIAIDKNNNLYLLGSFQETCSFDGVNELTSDGDYDVFLAKYSNQGVFLWAKKIAFNEARQLASSLDYDGSNLILTVNYSDSISFEGVSFSSEFGISYAKFDLDGSLLWAKNIITENTNSTLQSVSAFSDGYYLNGRFRGTVSFDLGDYTSNNSSYADVFLYKTDFDGNGQWLRRSYGDGNAFTGTITQDNYGNIYYTGLFNGTGIEVDSTASLISHNIKNNGNSDIFIFKYNKNGNLIWANGYGKEGSDWARDISFTNNFLYNTGYFSDTIIFDQDTLISSSNSDQDAFIGVFDTKGNPLRAAKIEDSDDGNESGMTLSIDSDNYIYWGGTFRSTSVVVGDSTFINPNPGNQCVFFTKGSTPLSSAFTKKTNPTCYGSTDGELVVTPYFGVSPYTYSWSHDAGLNDSTATGLSAATYTVTVTDALDSTAVEQHTLTEPDPFYFNPSITDVTTCSYSAEGAIDITITGGNGGNTFYWSSSEGGSEVNLTAEDQSGLTTGRYDVTVTDSEGCSADTAIYITGPEPITFGNSVVTDYSGPSAKGKIDLVYEGGSGDPASYSFNWEGPSGFTSTEDSIEELDPGNYTVTATDVHACNFDTTFSVIDLDTFYVYISDYKDACNGTINGKATVSYYSPDGHTDITYQWDGNAGNQTTAEATNLAPGRYYFVTVTDNENTPNIVMEDSVYIDELAYTFEGSISGSSTTTLDCYDDTDGFIDVNITSAGETPYTYLWNTGANTQDLTGLGIGTYSITATDANECQFSITNHEITQPDELLATAEIESRPSCNGDYDGELTVERSGGTSPYSYLWNDPGSQTERNATGLDAGFYTVTVTDSKGCKKSSSVNLTEPDAIQVSKNVFDVSCNGDNDGAVQLSVSGGTTPFSYFWDTNDGSGLNPINKDQSGLTAGKYYFTATDANNCIYEDSVEITQPEPLLIEEIAVNDATCNGATDGSIDITVTGGTVATDY
ncbi:MAG: SprB repeat-containing protein, partial [Thiohalospira sp.]